MYAEIIMVSSKIRKCMAIALIAEITEKQHIQKWNKEKKQRLIWTRKWILERNCSLRGIINLAHKELRIEDQEYFRRFFRMRIDLFDELLKIVTPYIQRQDTNMRECISPKERLSLTLRFLATGESYRSLEYATRIPACTISRIIPETCRVIYECLRKIYLKTPNITVEWEQIANDYQRLWNVPNCIGSMDGRHIEFRAPLKDGSLYYNYKSTNSIVLLALVNAKYQFTYVNVGVNGRVSDGGVFRDSDFAKLLNNAQNPLNLPQDKSLPDMNEPIPYVTLADAAFPLQKHILKPYPSRNLSHDERICNYRISRGRRVVENVFGILANKFRVLLTQMHLPVETVQNITLACCALHNYLIEQNAAYLYTDINNENLEEHTIRPAEWGNNMRLRNLEVINVRPNMNAIHIRNVFKKYFNTVGKVEWQEYMI